jgi:hypothetical protein
MLFCWGEHARESDVEMLECHRSFARSSHYSSCGYDLFLRLLNRHHVKIRVMPPTQELRTRGSGFISEYNSEPLRQKSFSHMQLLL